MQFSTWVRGAAAVVGTLMFVATGATPTLAATAADSIVPLGALDGTWSVVSKGADPSQTLDNYSVTFVNSVTDPSGMPVVAVVGLIVLPTPDLAQQVVQSMVDSSKATTPGLAVVPSQTYGDANGVELVQADTSSVTEGRVFVDKGTVVYVVSAGPPGQADLIKSTADTLATAQDAILPGN